MSVEETRGRSQLERGRRCYAEGRWADALAALSRADSDLPLAPRDLEQLVWAAAMCGNDEVFLMGLERLYRAHLDADAPAAAARTAFWLGFRLQSLDEPARGMGWLSRAQHLVDEQVGASAVGGYLLLPAVFQHLGAGALDQADEVAGQAVAIGAQFDDRDLVAIAQNLQGRARLRRGDVREGLALLDEAMLAATTGELSPLVTGLVYCIAIATCQQSHAIDRAREWTSALSRWCEAQPQLVTFTGLCQVHRAEIMQIGGDWPAAIEAARQVGEALSKKINADPEALGDACYQEAEVHRLRGDFEDAEASYRRASEAGREPQPGLALLRLARGRHEDAHNSIQRVLDTTTAPWERARFLPACVEIMLAGGKLERAQAACEELEALAATFDTEILGAMAAEARGSVCIARNEPRQAIESLRGAFEVWRRIAAPYLSARVRVMLGRAYRALGDRDGAELEIAAARRTFEQLGAAVDLAALEGLAAEAPQQAAHGLSRRELEVLRELASGKTNKEIARRLRISERTVDRHVSNIFTKIDVSTRAAATAFAYQNKLL